MLSIRFYKCSCLSLAVIVALIGCRKTETSRPERIEPTATIMQPTPTGQAAPVDVLELTLDEYGSIELAARAGFGDWLASYLTPQTSPAYRLREYRIDSIEPLEGTELSTRYDQVFRITYAVSPGFSPSNWIVGDGRFDQDGWVVDKLEHLGVNVVDGEILLHRLGPCPQC